jgi:DtxR family Mn-dependent transcriptional regulator
MAFKKLAEKDLINYIKYQGVSLTENGTSRKMIVRKHAPGKLFCRKVSFSGTYTMFAEQLEHIKSEN